MYKKNKTCTNTEQPNLAFAILNEQVEISDIYKKHFDFNVRYNGITPLQAAISMCLTKKYKTDLIRVLLTEGANPNETFLNGNENITPLMFLSTYQVENEGELYILYSIGWMLVRAGAHINFVSENGNTPLIYAAEYANLEMIYLLLTMGADPLKENHFKETALSILNKIADSPILELSAKISKSNTFKTLVRITDIWKKRGGYANCAQQEGNWIKQDDGAIDKYIGLKNYITKEDEMLLTIDIYEAEDSLFKNIGLPYYKKTWLLFFKFERMAIPDTKGDAQVIVFDTQKNENCKAFLMRYTIENGICILECVDRFGAEKFINFIKYRDSVYVYFNFTGELEGIDLSFNLHKTNELHKYFGDISNETIFPEKWDKND